MTVKFKSGYKDQATTVDVVDAAGNVTGQEDVRYKVNSFASFDWQTVWTPSKQWALTAGVLNLTDKQPAIRSVDLWRRPWPAVRLRRPLLRRTRPYRLRQRVVQVLI
jgi:outer membrane receptor protein involved in Fe transport